MQAAIDGGFEIVEFTLTTPGCLDAVSDFRSKYDGKVMVGCGTVMDIPDAKAAIDAGAEFLVAPILQPEVRNLMRNLMRPLQAAAPRTPYAGHPLHTLRPPHTLRPSHTLTPSAHPTGGHVVRAAQHRHHPRLPDAD